MNEKVDYLSKANVIIQTLQGVGIPTLVVGGFCRDYLLGLEPKDIDLCTPLHPDEVYDKLKLIKNEHGVSPRIYETGRRFGTLGIKLCGELVEITSFRTEQYNKDNRKPEVKFTNDLKSDLSRRDFTFNALAYDGKHFIDYFDGIKHLKEGKVVAVGNATLRLKEDFLRSLRAIRFASKYNFTIDEFLFSRIQKFSYKILNISKERWMQELDKILISDYTDKGLDYLQESGLMKFMIPELVLQVSYDQNSKYHDYALWEHTKGVVRVCPKDINLRWSALLHDIAKPMVRLDRYNEEGVCYKSNYIHHETLGAELVKKTGVYLKWSNERIKSVSDIVRNHLKDESPLREYDNWGKKLK